MLEKLREPNDSNLTPNGNKFARTRLLLKRIFGLSLLACLPQDKKPEPEECNTCATFHVNFLTRPCAASGCTFTECVSCFLDRVDTQCSACRRCFLECPYCRQPAKLSLDDGDLEQLNDNESNVDRFCISLTCELCRRSCYSSISAAMLLPQLS